MNESINIGNNKSRTLIKNESTFIDNKGNYGITTCLGALENTLDNVEFNLWKDFIGFTCIYAIEYVDDVVFVPGKCEVSVN